MWSTLISAYQTGGLYLSRDNSNSYYAQRLKHHTFLFFCRISMATSCAHLCLQCRSLLCSKKVASTWQYYTHVRHCIRVTQVPTKILDGSSIVKGTHKTNPAKQMQKQQVFCYSDFAAKHLATGAEENKDVEETSCADVVAFKSPMLPIRDAVLESQVSLGTY